MASALELALKSTEEPDYSPYASEVRLKQVIFITDGSVGNEEHLMQVIHQNLKDKRLFTVGIGSAPNTYFMSEAAKVGKGSFTYINDINQVGQKMRGLFAQINHPVLSDIQFDFPANVEFYPDNIPDLYTDQPLLVTYKGSTWGDTIMASGNLTKANWSTTFPPAMLSSTFRDYQRKPTGLNVLWAKNKIEQLTSQRRKSDDREKFNQAIESTALTHHLVSEFTSLVAVDVTPSRPLNVEPKDASIANNLPFGMPKNMLVLPQTATTGQLRFIVGLLLIVISLCLHLITNRR
jgi:Ca-activated chloride channel family protein